MIEVALYSNAVQSCSTVGPTDAGHLLYSAELSFAHGLQDVSSWNTGDGYLCARFLQFTAHFAATTI